MTTLAEVTLEAGAGPGATGLPTPATARRAMAPGQAIDFWIVGMGKLGARELNVSSDIDLIYVYEDGTWPATSRAADARRGLAHEYFSQVAKRLYALIGDTTEDGFVFRVDLALRPNGNSGPAGGEPGHAGGVLPGAGPRMGALCLAQEPRCGATGGGGRAGAAAGRCARWSRPSSTASYLDYGVFEGLRQLHRKIREEAQRRAAGRPERANDVKLSRGGIREIEFIVQLHAGGARRALSRDPHPHPPCAACSAWWHAA